MSYIFKNIYSYIIYIYIYNNNIYIYIYICVYIYCFITEAGLAQSRASVGAKAASVARNKEG